MLAVTTKGGGWFDFGEISDVELSPEPVSTGEFNLDTGAYVPTMTVKNLNLRAYVPTITVKNSNLPLKPGDTINVTWDDYEEGALYSGVLLEGFYDGPGLQPEQPKQPEQKKKKKKKRAIEYNDPMRSISLKDEG